MAATRVTLEAQDLCGGYHGVTVLHGVNLSVSSGEVVALLGPNGAGKTTTLLMLAGLLTPRGGRILWQGKQAVRPAHRLARSGLAYVGERAVFQRLTVGDNLRLGQGRVERALELFPELVPLLRRRAGLLSGGEQRMLTVGRAIAAGSSVMIVDELSVGLAPVAVNRLLEAIREESATNGLGVLLVEQQLVRALAVADRGYVMSRGRITFQGTASELRADSERIRETYFDGTGE